jgi:hypothetical protein
MGRMVSSPASGLVESWLNTVVDQTGSNKSFAGGQREVREKQRDQSAPFA